jgi:nicotinamide mononucleotide transporter
MIDFLGGMFGTRWIEIVAAIFGLINVTLLVRRNIWNYPFGIAMVILYGFVFFEARLYSDVILQVFFLVIQCFGWWWWLARRDPDGLVIVQRMPPSAIVSFGTLAIFGSLTLGWIMATYTNAALPYMDATTTVLSIIAQYLLARRYLENWIVWIVVDVLAIGIYLSKGLQPTAALYGIFLILAATGYYSWRNASLHGTGVAS